MIEQADKAVDTPFQTADTPAPGIGSGMLLRMLVFGTLFAAILLGATWISAVTWSSFYGTGNIYVILAPMLVTGSFVPLMFLGFRRRNATLRVLSIVSSTALGFLNFALFAALACWLVLGAARLAGLTPDTRALAIVMYGVAAFVSFGGIINAAWLRTTRATVRLPGLPEAWRGRDIALVSDVHLGSIRSRAFARRIVARLNHLKPFAVFISGDMFDGPEREPDRVVQPWAGLTAPAGAYLVSGNHDEFHERAAVLASLERVGLRVLHNEKVCVEGMQILGVHDGETRAPLLYAEILRAMDISPSMPSILLAHQPDSLDIPERAGVSLQLSGHTHGGQFWPWNLIVSRMYGSFAHGLSRMGNMQVFTSSGAGTWGPPMRVGTRSEIVLLRLEGARGVTP